MNDIINKPYQNKKYLKILFIISIALNLLFIGFLGAKGISHYKRYGHAWHYSQSPEAQALIQEYRPIFKQTHKEVRYIIRDMRDILAQENINEQQFNDVIDKTKQLSNQSTDHLIAIATKIKDAPFEQRQQFVKILKHIKMKGGKIKHR